MPREALPPRWAAECMARAIDDLQKIVPVGMSAQAFRQQDSYMLFLYAVRLLEFAGDHLPRLDGREFWLSCQRPNLLVSYTPQEVRSWLGMLVDDEAHSGEDESPVLRALRSGALDHIAARLRAWPRR